MALLGLGAILGWFFGLRVGSGIADLLSLPPDTPRLALMIIGSVVCAVLGMEIMRRLAR